MNADERTPARLDVDDDVGKLFERLESGDLTNDEQRRLGQSIQATCTVHQLSITRSGLLPVPEELNGYDKNTRREIVTMAVEEQRHSHEMQRTGLTGAIEKDRRGQLYGLIIAVVGLLVAGFAAVFSPVAATIIGSLDLLGMVAIFVVPRIFERRGPAAGEPD